MKRRNCIIIAKKELQGLFSEKTILLAILLQLFIAMFSSFLLVGLASMYNPDSISQYSTIKYPVGVTGNTTSPLTGQLASSDNFVIYEMELGTALAALKERKLSAVIWIPGIEEYSADPITITLYVIQNDIQSSIVNVKLKDALLDYEDRLRKIRQSRLEFKPVELILPETNPSSDFYEFVYGLLIPLLVFMPAIISGALIIDLITEEYQQDTLETLMSTPVTFPEMIWGKTAACLGLVPVQSAGWLLLLMANGIAISGFVPIILHVTAGSMVIILIGALIALKYRERTNAQFIFSTALVVVILASLAVPLNPANLIVRLSVDSIGPVHWLVLAMVMGVCVILSYLMTGYAKRVEGKVI
ncbi:ABC transporter permease [Methanoplanus endosymbiosus]|uniref:ABC transporter permease n=1 Tax=Methanoplanus endosymbiosus TaxID=33865 RepID=A0A9E7TL38_9EURY|nr:ABC transporter permease [Methanoplanus endosymbiosus]UUX93404.1 ABC transporter permease [Methanoplanus endosymbiosus]